MIFELICLLIGVLMGIVSGMIIIKINTKKKELKLKEELKNEAEVLKKEKLLQAKEKFLILKEEHEKVIFERERKLNTIEKNIKDKNIEVSRKIEQIKKEAIVNQKLKSEVNLHINSIKEKNEKVSLLIKRQTEQLEKISNLTKEEAEKRLINILKTEAETEAIIKSKEIIDKAKTDANKEAKKIVISTIQRVATEKAIENSISTFNIPSEEIKGRIIGREGRNIRAFEACTGVEVIIDDTPEAIVLSCFDPVRREIARLSLHQLVTDGRIHPAKIEEVVAKTKKLLNEEIIEVGNKTCIDLGIHGLHNELIRLVGKMKYRSSYGQNLLKHSREVANLCAIMASELGIDKKSAKRAGLLHDIGKVSEETQELPHAIAGMKLAEKYNEKPDICNAIGAHHDEIEMNDIISPIIQICDGISGSRPGARREIVDSYINRIKDLEAIGMSYPGINEAYAIQAGRELRVIVESDKVSDQEADTISLNLAKRIEDELTYPAQVRVTVVREKRAINYAK